MVSEFAELLRQYGIGTVRGDRYAGEWPREVFRKRGITYAPTKWTKADSVTYFDDLTAATPH